MSRRSGLGRGLAALIPPSEAKAPADQPTEKAQNSPESAPKSDARSASEITDDAVADNTADDGVPAGHETVRHTDDDTSAGGARPSADDAATESAQSGQASAPTPVAPTSTTAPAATATTATSALTAENDGRSIAPAVAATTATVTELTPDEIITNPKQPRDIFDPEELEGLAVSLADMGMLQPLVVRPRDDGAYELIAGERRLRAAKIAGLATVPAVVRHTDDSDLLKEALVENIHRVQLNPLEEGAAYQQLLEEFGATQEELAATLGKSRPAISNAIRLLQLPPAVQRRVAAGVLSAGHAKALLSIPSPKTQADIAERIVQEGLSVRATEELIRIRVLEEESTTARHKKRTPTAPGLVELQQDLSDALMTRVKISMGARKGRVAIEFGSVDDLERIVGVIANGLGPGSSSLNADTRPMDTGPDATDATTE